jgi:hypothetical protein
MASSSPGFSRRRSCRGSRVQRFKGYRVQGF